MSEVHERPPSPIPVPWPFRPPYALEPSHPLYSHVTRDHEQQAAVQARWDAEWDEFDRYYQQTRSRHTRTEQTRHNTAASPVPRQCHYQRQQDQHPYNAPSDSRDGPRGCRERWRNLGRDYVRDSPDSEWVEAWKPTIHPVTDIYGFPPGDPMYRPHLRYTPRESEHEDLQRNEGATQSVGNQLPPHATGRPEMPPRYSGNWNNGGRIEPIDHGNARAPTVHLNPIGPDAVQQRQVSASSQAPAGPLETREDPWEFLFGSKGYTTLAQGNERPFWWDWED